MAFYFRNAGSFKPERRLFSAGLCNQKARNRKPLEETPGPFGATWELHCGPGNRFRVFYEIVWDRREVWILAIGVKERERLYFAGKEFLP